MKKNTEHNVTIILLALALALVFEASQETFNRVMNYTTYPKEIIGYVFGIAMFLFAFAIIERSKVLKTSKKEPQKECEGKAEWFARMEQ